MPPRHVEFNTPTPDGFSRACVSSFLCGPKSGVTRARAIFWRFMLIDVAFYCCEKEAVCVFFSAMELAGRLAVQYAGT